MITFNSKQLRNPISGSFQGDFTGSFTGDGSGLTNLPVQNIATSSFATTGSNQFNGNQTITGSLIQGLGNIATGENSHAEGDSTQAIGNFSHAEGLGTIAYGGRSHAEGQDTIASGSYSHAEGYGTIALADHQHVQGQYNITSSVPAAFIVGNGTDSENRSNLIHAAGNEVQISGSLNVVGGITGSFTGSFAGDGSQLTGIVSSKWSGTNPITRTSDVEITGSLRVTNSITASLFGTASFAQTAAVAPNYLPLTGGTITGSLTINNNLTVLGSASIQYISESTLNIGTNLITVNTLNPGARFGGLAVIDSGSLPQVSASFLYDSVQDAFIFVHKGTAASAITSSHFLVGPETYNDVGNELYLTANRIPKSIGNEHLNDSNISDNGSVVSINSNTQITGSLLVTAGITGSFSGSGANLSNIPSSAITGLNLNQISSGSVSASISPNNGLQINTNVTATSFTGSLFGTASSATSASYVNITQSLGFTPEDVSNKTTSTSLGTSDTLYPSQNAVKTYVDTAVNSAVLSPASKLFNYYNFI